MAEPLHSSADSGAAVFHGVNAVSGEPLEPAFHSATPADVAAACARAGAAFDVYRALPREARARFLETIADRIMAIGEPLIERAMAESGLPRARLEGERGRTVGQLRLFAGVVRDGGYLGLRRDEALPDRQPPRPEIRMRRIPLGPVAVFAASNFPLAFSVAGGDTASALAAGCPVVVKAHPAHPGVSDLIARAVHDAVRETGLPEGVFSIIFEAGFEAGLALVSDPHIKAVGFTGSRGGGMALMAAAAKRPEPIPVHAEMSSINPVILMPGALTDRAEAIGQGFAGALTLGAGQFCTNPGLVLAVAGPGLDRFETAASAALTNTGPMPMLTAGIRDAYRGGVARLDDHGALTTLVRTGPAEGGLAGSALFSVSGRDFLAHPELQHEVFGASAVVVRCADVDELATVLEGLEGQLTAAIHLGTDDAAAATRLLPILERKAGRILADGFGTGVEVSSAMVHGGPWPATSDSRTTSVGTLAIDRFLRPVCYQNLPAELLPADFG